MATVFQSGSKATPKGSQLDPVLKEILDAVVLPALVKAYLLKNADENGLAVMPSAVRHSDLKDATSVEGVP